MAEATQQQQTPPAATAGGIDMDALVGRFTEALNAKLKPLQDELAALKAVPKADADPKAAKEPAAADKPLTAADVERMVGERLTAANKQAADQQARATFAGDKMKDLPEVYRNQLGTDPAKWAAEEQTIRGNYRADFAAAGGKAPPVQGTPPGNAGGQPAAGAVNLDQNSAQANIAAGLKMADAAGK